MSDAARAEGKLARAPIPEFSWTSLGKGGVEVESSAKKEALELARAAAAQTVVLDRDAVPEELVERTRAVAETMWPASPLSGYGLHSSLGAYVVAKVAVGWAPSGMIGLRHEPLDREKLVAELSSRGVERTTAIAVLGDWKGVEPGFVPDPSGLDTSRLAGLAEGTLSRAERGRALSQIAYSARCLDRLASTVSVLGTLRHILPLLAPEALGPAYVAGSAAIALGRFERAVELLGERPSVLADRTLAELASAIVQLERAESPRFSDEGALLVPGVEEPKRAADEGDDDRDDPWSDTTGREVPTPDDDDGDDVLEIVEEKVDETMRISGIETASGSNPPARKKEPLTPVRPRPARWPAQTGDAPEAISDAELDLWALRLRDAHGLVSERRGLLGLRLPPIALAALAAPTPPDERLVTSFIAGIARAEDGEARGRDVTERVPVGLLMTLEALSLGGTPFDALFPAVRGALRAIIRAADGIAPSKEAIEHAGDLAWILLRARALALIVQGDLQGAVHAVAELPREAAPEGEWARDRLQRFGGRRTPAVEREEARPAAASLAADLAQQLGRTIAGTLPDSRRSA